MTIQFQELLGSKSIPAMKLQKELMQFFAILTKPHSWDCSVCQFRVSSLSLRHMSLFVDTASVVMDLGMHGHMFLCALQSQPGTSR